MTELLATFDAYGREADATVVEATETSIDIWRARASAEESPTVLPSLTEPLRWIPPNGLERLGRVDRPRTSASPLVGKATPGAPSIAIG